jgi:hypothetical protein
VSNTDNVGVDDVLEHSSQDMWTLTDDSTGACLFACENSSLSVPLEGWKPMSPLCDDGSSFTISLDAHQGSFFENTPQEGSLQCTQTVEAMFSDNAHEQCYMTFHHRLRKSFLDLRQIVAASLYGVIVQPTQE